MLGQVIDRRSYFSGYSRVDEWLSDNVDQGFYWMIDHGFYAGDGDSTSLEQAWKRALTPAS